MRTVIADFEKRVSEIETYFRLLDAFEERDAKLSVSASGNRRTQSVGPELKKVLRANAFLLLFNLAESSIRQAIERLMETISLERMTYSDASDQVKTLWIREGHNSFKNQSASQVFQSLSTLGDDIIDFEFHGSSLGNGNVDGRKIREVANEYGFSSSVHANARDGVKLHEVKCRRNDLAHGLVSFAQCGRNYTISDLRRTKHEVVMYLRGILRNISRFIEKKRFRK